MLRPAGDFDRSYEQDMALLRRPWHYWLLGFSLLAAFTLPLWGDAYLISTANQIAYTIIVCAGPEHPDRLHRPDLTEPGGLYASGRLRVGAAGYSRRSLFLHRAAAGRARRRRSWPVLRPGEPAGQGLLPGFRDTGGPVHHPLAEPPHIQRVPWRHQRRNRCAGSTVGHAELRRSQQLLLYLPGRSVDYNCPPVQHFPHAPGPGICQCSRQRPGGGVAGR